MIQVTQKQIQLKQEKISENLNQQKKLLNTVTENKFETYDVFKRVKKVQFFCSGVYQQN